MTDRVLVGPAAEPEKHGQEVTDGLLAALREYDKEATATFSMADHAWHPEEKIVRIATTVFGCEHTVSLLARKDYERWGRSHTETLQIESGLAGHLRRLKQRKDGGFNYARLAAGIVDEARRRVRQAEEAEQRKANEAAHKAIIDDINALHSFVASPSPDGAQPIRINLTVNSNVTQAKAEAVLRFLREFKATT